MTGIAAVDLSDAGINHLADIRAGAYDPQLLAFAGITEDRLAAIAPSGQVIGNLTAAAAEELGLTTDCVLVSGAHDQYAVALGAGAISKRIWPSGGRITRAPNVGNIEEYIARVDEMCERKKELWAQYS